jgi:D-amino-acid dehydrogenase
LYIDAGSSDQSKSIAVVGAGIVGICCALALQKSGADVTLIDREGIAKGCSEGNAGHFATEQVFPLSDKSLLPKLPSMLLKKNSPLAVNPTYFFKALPWFSRFLINMRIKHFENNTSALKSLNELSMSSFESLLKDLKMNHHLIKRGSLLTFETSNNKIAEYELKKYRKQGINVKLLDKSKLKELESTVSGSVKSALYFTETGHTLDPKLLCQELADSFIERGGKIGIESVTEIRPETNGIRLRFDQTTRVYQQVVICTGAWTNEILKPLGYKFPLDTERGYHYILPVESTIQRPIASAERGFIMTPMQRGLKLAGTVEFAGLEKKMNVTRAKLLLPHAKHLLNNLNLETEEGCTAWMGLRPSLPDSLPVIGAAPKHKNIFLAFGHQHLGLTQAAITGKLISQLMNDQVTEIDVSPFCISRFDKSLLRKEEAI